MIQQISISIKINDMRIKYIKKVIVLKNYLDTMTRNLIEDMLRNPADYHFAKVMDLIQVIKLYFMIVFFLIA